MQDNKAIPRQHEPDGFHDAPLNPVVPSSLRIVLPKIWREKKARERLKQPRNEVPIQKQQEEGTFGLHRRSHFLQTP